MAKWDADDLFPLLESHSGRYRRNFIKQAVCELKFPTMLGLGVAQPPKAFVNGLRKKYPILEHAKELPLSPLDDTSSGHVHIVKSAKENWTITLRRDTVLVETQKYHSFSEMRARVLEVVEVVAPLIDSDFFTRIGLRYINQITTDGENPLSQWVSPGLVGMLEGQHFSGVNELAGRLRLQKSDGGILLQHGLKHKAITDDEATKVPDYVIDIDGYRQEVSLEHTGQALDIMRRQIFTMFRWTLGDRAKSYLGELED